MKTYLVVIDDKLFRDTTEQRTMSMNGIKSVTNTSTLDSSSRPFTSKELDEFVLEMGEAEKTISLPQLKKNLEVKFEDKWIKA
jgi:hypothetical protein